MGTSTTHLSCFQWLRTYADRSPVPQGGGRKIATIRCCLYRWEWIRTPFLTAMREKNNQLLILTLSLILANLQGGCSQNPQLRRQKFYEQGIVYFDKGKYP